RQLALGHRSCVHIAAGLRPRYGVPNGNGEALETVTEHTVVVGRPGILGDSPRGPTDPGRETGIPGLAPGVSGLAPGVSRAMEVVREGHHGDLRAGHDTGG